MRYWIKLWTETIADPKMGPLPDRIWRRAIETFMLAGIEDGLGELPSLKGMSWQLHVDEESLAKDLDVLVDIGILGHDDKGYWVVQWSKRQSRSAAAERMEVWRKRQRGDLPPAPEPEPLDESLSPELAKLAKLYEQHISMIDPMTLDLLREAMTAYPEAWIEPAMKEAVKNGVRKWNYVEAILARWKIEGYNSPKVKHGNGNGNGNGGNGNGTNYNRRGTGQSLAERAGTAGATLPPADPSIKARAGRPAKRSDD